MTFPTNPSQVRAKLKRVAILSLISMPQDALRMNLLPAAETTFSTIMVEPKSSAQKPKPNCAILGPGVRIES